MYIFITRTPCTISTSFLFILNGKVLNILVQVVDYYTDYKDSPVYAIGARYGDPCECIMSQPLAWEADHMYIFIGFICRSRVSKQTNIPL